MGILQYRSRVKDYSSGLTTQPCLLRNLSLSMVEGMKGLKTLTIVHKYLNQMRE